MMLGLAAAAEPVRHYYTYLGDITPAESSVGWGSFQVNRNWYMDGFRIDGKTYDTGVFAHAPSSLVYDLGSRFTMFTGFVGLDDGSAEHATFQKVKDECQNAQVVATVYVDGEIAGQPMVLQRTAGKYIHPIAVNITRHQELRLTAQLLNADSTKCANNEGAEVAWVDAKLAEDPEIECVDLGEILPEAQSVGWGSYWVNKNWYQSGFMINNIRYSTGVFAHAKSEIVYNLKDLTSGGERTWSDFSFCVGLDDHYNNKDCKDDKKGVHFQVDYLGTKTWNSKDTHAAGMMRNMPALCDGIKLYDATTETTTDKLTISAYSATNPDGNDECQEAEWVNARVCMDRSPKDCVVSEWSAYGECDRTCGSGVKTRTRTVKKWPQFGGALCPKLDDIARCNEHACPIDCKYTEWSDYDDVECDRSCGTGHQYRYRGITRHESFGGKACPETKQSRACNTHPCPLDCTWQPVLDNGNDGLMGWSKWTECTASCGGGTTSRSRKPDPKWSAATSYGGKSCDTNQMETRECNNHCCPVDCDLTPFGPWGGCTATCGTGFRIRKREHRAEPSCGGKTCGVLTQVEECNKRACPIDCEVSSWSAAHSCSHSCGAFGTQIRHRSINIYPAFGGLECPHLSETKECGAEPCPVDCLTSSFGQWTTCSRSCGTGEHARRRSIRRAVEHGGKECPHLLEMRKCNKHDCPVDCKVGPWNVTGTQWNDQSFLDKHCSKSCGTDGRATRSRKMISSHSAGGKPCGAADMIEHKSCNTQACPSDCVVSSWSSWTQCSVSCIGKAGNGIQYRLREIVNASHFGGKGCPPVNEQRFCVNKPPCPIDCDLSGWSDWTMCTKTCNGGYQKRTREIFATAKFGGKACPAKLEEPRACGEQNCPVACEVSAWKEGPCDATCGAGTRVLTRTPTQKPMHGGAPCPVLKKTRPCAAANGKKCPVDCVYTNWGPYSTCSSECWDGKGAKPTKKSIRSVLVKATAGGKPCDESTQGLERISSCNEQIPCAVDCQVGDWSDWKECSRSCGHGIQVRVRASKNNNKNTLDRACPKTVDARSCNEFACPVDCAMTEWSEWDECSKKCEMGFQYRTRTILGPVVPLNGGKACGEVQQMQNCNMQACPKDCTVSEWKQESPCTATCGFGTRGLIRSQTQKASNGGKACPALYKVEECNLPACPIDCEYQEWNQWSACSATCGSGEKIRRRGTKVHAQFGGKPCDPKANIQKDTCWDMSCKDSCLLDAWKAGTCNAQTDKHGACGDGVQEWSTTILGFANSCPSFCKNGKCTTTRQCFAGRKCQTDCKVSDWKPVTSCSKSCGGGKRTMERSVLVAAKNGGDACPALKTEHDCNVDACPIDCTVSGWSDYSACSTTCGGNGVMIRTRLTVSTAKNGGAACPALKEERPCNMGPCPVHCELTAWSKWTMCSHSCGTTGMKTRSRQISRFPTFGGHVCGSLKHEVKCGRIECPIDCEVSAFSNFGTCSQTCGGGEKKRFRTITVTPQFGGRACPEGRANGECNLKTGQCTHGAACNQFKCGTGPNDEGMDHAYHQGEGLDYLPTIAPTKTFKFENGKFENVGKVVGTIKEQADLTGQPTAFPTAAPTVAPHLQFCMNGKWRVPVGWRGAGYGSNFCNLCKCTHSKGSHGGLLQCQKKSCNIVSNGKVCSATTCKFVYNPLARKEVMIVTHNTGNDKDGFKQEERFGSHHRCAYSVDGQAPHSHTVGPQALERAATNSRSSGKNCVCLCYGNAYTQEAHPRLSSEFVTDQNKFGQANQGDNEKGSVGTNGQAHRDAKETKEHNDGSHISTYYVNQWGKTPLAPTTTELNHPTPQPTAFPTKFPTVEQIEATATPTNSPTAYPTPEPTFTPTFSPTWNAEARAQTLSAEAAFKASVQKEMATFAALPYGATISADVQKEFNAWLSDTGSSPAGDAHKWRGNLVRFNAVKDLLKPLLISDMKNWNLKTQTKYIEYFWNQLQKTCTTSGLCKGYVCSDLNKDWHSTGGAVDTSVLAATCPSDLAQKQHMLVESVHDATDAITWNAGITGTPTQYPTTAPTAPPSTYPTARPTTKNTNTLSPTAFPTKNPTTFPTAYPTEKI